MEVNSIEKCKLCMSINDGLKCDSVDTKYSEPELNFPCMYWNDREFWIKQILKYNNDKTFEIE